MLPDNKAQLCIGIFTVKKVYFFKNKYYTYGGFGDYINGMCARFEKIILAARVKEKAPGEGFYELNTSNVQVVHLPQPNNELQNLLQLPLVFFKALKCVKKMDVVHNRMPDYTGIIGALTCKLYNKPYFVQVIADWQIEAKKISPWKGFGKGFFLKCDYMFYDKLERWACKNKLVFAQGISCYKKHAKHSNCHLVVSTAHYSSDIVQVLPIKFTAPIKKILNVGRLTGVKNQELLIKAIAILKEKGEEWELHILGFGPLEEALRNLAVKLGIEQSIFFHGQIERGARLWEYFDAADVFVLSSRSEGTPKVLLEAMARGLPVVASNVGGIPTATDNGNRALLFEDNNLTDLLLKLKQLEDDVALRDKIVSNGRNFAAAQTVEGSADFMLEELKKTFPHLFLKSNAKQ